MDAPVHSNRGGCNGNIGSPMGSSHDPSGVVATMNFDGYSELCGTSVADHIFSLLNDQTGHQMLALWSSLGSSPRASGMSGTMPFDAFSGPEEAVAAAPPKTDSVLSVNPDAADRAAKSSGELISDNGPETESSIVPRPVAGSLFAERMLMALSLFRESLGTGILAQVWMPIEQGDQVVLSTCEQPFLLDQVLTGYREVSRRFVFSAKEEPPLHPGLPGRVFISGVPEWTSSVLYYNKPEYLRMEYALHHNIRGSLAMPIYDPGKGSCCAVLELVTKNEKLNFDAEMDSVCNALQAVNLKTTKEKSCQKFYTENQKSAFTEILDVLRAICYAHMLPLALTWVPSFNGNDDSYVVGKNGGIDSESGRTMLRVHESASYVTDVKMQGFLHACAERHLEKGQGIVGRALKSNLPFFSPNIREYSIEDYPLAHHARKFGLHAAVAVRLRSTYTGNDDYILEFFLPVNCRGSGEQQMLLNNLSSTMQRICKSLRTVSDAEVDKMDACTTMMYERTNESYLPTGHPANSHGDQAIEEVPLGDLSLVDEQEGNVECKQVQSSSKGHAEKKRSTAEKNISLDVLRKYFSGSLKDAAKSLGVCPTTLKRICRQHGISRWPSRKINKVNRSLKKIQNVINSVHGVDGSLQYDPATGSLISAVSLPDKIPFPTRDAVPTPSVQSGKEKSGPKSEQKHSSDSWQMECLCQLQHRNAQKRDGDELCILMNNVNNIGNNASYDASLSQHSNPEATRQDPVYAIGAVSSLSLKETDSLGPSVTVCPSAEIIEEADANMVDDHEAKEHTRPSTSGMTDSSSGSASCHHPTFKQNSKYDLTVIDKSSPALTVKATYNGDTVRFKFAPSMGWYHLQEEVAKRFKLSTGAFQMKYKDDEDEWVILANDSDLQECIDVLASVGTHNVKLQVRDLLCVIGSSGSSSCLQLEGHSS